MSDSPFHRNATITAIVIGILGLIISFRQCQLQEKYTPTNSNGRTIITSGKAGHQIDSAAVVFLNNSLYGIADNKYWFVEFYDQEYAKIKFKGKMGIDAFTGEALIKGDILEILPNQDCKGFFKFVKDHQTISCDITVKRAVKEVRYTKNFGRIRKPSKS